MLAVHLTCSCGWIGVVLGYLALGIASTVTEQSSTITSSWVAWSCWVVRAGPVGVGVLNYGHVAGVATRWGLFRQYWVLFAFAMTLLATVVLILHLPSVSRTAS